LGEAERWRREEEEEEEKRKRGKELPVKEEKRGGEMADPGLARNGLT
jgi:hypothetical protein